jgi:hypothetical protein
MQKDVWGSEDIAPCILNFNTNGRLVSGFTPRTFDPRGSTPFYLLDSRLDGHHSSSDAVKRRKTLAPAGNRKPNTRSSNPHYNLYIWYVNLHLKF